MSHRTVGNRLRERVKSLLSDWLQFYRDSKEGVSISSSKPQINDPVAADHSLLEAAVREAGALALGYYHARLTGWAKQDKSPVSEADMAVDRLLQRRLRPLRPDYGWLSEETADTPERLQRSRVWVVDPIDGTRAFLKGRPWWCISAALVQDGVPVLGMIYAPVLNEFYHATAGGGAWLGAERLKVSAAQSIAGSRVLCGPHVFRPDRWPEPWPDMQVEQRNSFAYRVALVASGRFDALYAPSSKCEWDMAAGDLLLREAGGVLTSLDGQPLSYNAPIPVRHDLVGAPPGLHQRFLQRIRSRG